MAELLRRVRWGNVARLAALVAAAALAIAGPGPCGRAQPAEVVPPGAALTPPVADPADAMPVPGPEDAAAPSPEEAATDARPREGDAAGGRRSRARRGRRRRRPARDRAPSRPAAPRPTPPAPAHRPPIRHWRSPAEREFVPLP